MICKLKKIKDNISVNELLKENGFDYDVVFGHFRLSGDDYIRPFGEAGLGHLTFYKGHSIEEINNSVAAVIMLSSSYKHTIKLDDSKCFIFVDNVRQEFANLLNKLTYEYEPRYIISRQYGPNVIVEEGAKIGVNVKLMGNNYIHSNVEIGNNVIVQPGAIIGGEGFGHILDGDHYFIFPHIGKVIIEDDVVIGSNTCIDRGTLGDTIIKHGCRIDNLVHIAHNDVINENCLITAGTVIGGSVTIGKNSRIGISTNILQGTKIGSRVVSGMGACINKDTNDGMLTYGVPAKERREVTKSLLED